jgi:hypothetical protein
MKLIGCLLLASASCLFHNPWQDVLYIGGAAEHHQVFRLPMNPIKGIYKIPNLKLAYFIFPSPEHRKLKSRENKKTTEYFERILRSKDRVMPRANLLWKIKRVYECDFLETIERLSPTESRCTNLPSHTLKDMGLLSMNLVKNSESDPTYFTPKSLDIVGIEDIIEVFI